MTQRPSSSQTARGRKPSKLLMSTIPSRETFRRDLVVSDTGLTQIETDALACRENQQAPRRRTSSHQDDSRQTQEDQEAEEIRRRRDEHRRRDRRIELQPR